LRHGESVGNSSLRLIGSGDPELSETGRTQIQAAGARLRGEVVDLVVASPLRRAWQSAWLVAGGVPVLLEPSFRETHFGRWEGLTQQEIEAADPVAFRDWTAGADGFEFPGGEPRADFRTRVRTGLERLLASPARSALLVSHKGVVRAVIEQLASERLERVRPGLGEVLFLTRQPDGKWVLGKRSSNPPGLGEIA
jgi:broad specificity phosphatase PhoE